MSDQTGGEYKAVKTEDELIVALRQTLGCPFVTENNFAPRRVTVSTSRSLALTECCRGPNHNTEVSLPSAQSHFALEPSLESRQARILKLDHCSDGRIVR
jgi:hypothetical protein